MQPTQRLYVDLTCAFEEIGRIAHGTLRVERGLVGAFADLALPNISFVRYDRARSRFVVVATEDALRIVSAPVKPEARRDLRAPWRRHPLLESGKQLERWVRRSIRDPVRRWSARPPETASGSTVEPANDARFEPGSTLLLIGELRQNQLDLVTLRRAGIKLAFFFYDLLNVLPDGDPALFDRNTTLPFSDFVAREADCVLAISRFSADALRAHLVRRKVSFPPISIVRLSGGLSRSVASVPVAGLAPRQFVVAVGDITPRKNQKLLIDVWRTLAANGHSVPPLVLAGRIDPACNEMVRETLADAPLAEIVKVLPNLGDAEVSWLFENCRFSVFPSLKEGFGLPVAESLSRGRVCVASSAAAIPEAGQGAAISLDPHDRDAWQACIALLLSDGAELDRREREIAQNFRAVSWLDCASDVLAGIDRMT